MSRGRAVRRERARWAGMLAGCGLAACAHTPPLPLPSAFREEASVRMSSIADVDRMRLLQGATQNPIRVGSLHEDIPTFPWANPVRLPPFVRSLLTLAESAHAGGRYDEAIMLAEGAVGASEHAVMSRTEREAVRYRAWRILAQAWRGLGHPGRARVAATMAALAEHFGRTAEARRSSQEFAAQLEALDEAVQARNEAAAAADEAADTAALNASLRVAASTVSAVSAGELRSLESSLSFAQSMVGTMNEAARVEETGRASVRETDAEIARGSAAQLENLSLDSPDLQTIVTTLAGTVRSYLETSRGDCDYLIAAFEQLGLETRWSPPNYDRALDMIERNVPPEGACGWRREWQVAFNLIDLSSTRSRSNRASGERAPRSFRRPAPTPPTTQAVADRDHDHVPDPTDACADEPEDRDGFEDGDGCPDTDNDGDGFGDAVDRCPNQAETLNGFEDRDGCPDVALDSDGDLVLDPRDRCPQDAEVYNGRDDADGCPDRGRALIRLDGSLVLPVRPLVVRPGRRFLRKSELTLGAIAALTQNTASRQLSITVLGDAVGGDAAFEAVRAALTASGLAPDRIERGTSAEQTGAAVGIRHHRTVRLEFRLIPRR